ncbi:MAG: ABC transporter permease, partial [Bifidobacteriaceae bacterium]|nr:ABC transporter permease [Bifidobacteriaceae bacterium]
VAFSELDNVYGLEPIKVAVVEDAAYAAQPGLAAAIEAASSGEAPLFDVTPTDSADEAARLVDEGGFYGYIAVGPAGRVGYHSDWREYPTYDPSHGVVRALLDSYLQHQELATDLATSLAVQTAASAAQAANGPVDDAVQPASPDPPGPAASAPNPASDPAAQSNTASSPDPASQPDPAPPAGSDAPAPTEAQFSQSVQITANPPSDRVRYFYAALGFATLTMSTFALHTIHALKANASPLGARRSVGGRGRWALATPALAASWAMSFAALAAGYCYMRFALDVAFGGAAIQALAILLVGSLVSTGLGAAIGCLPLRLAVADSMVTGLTCALSLFAGLYGPATQLIGDKVAQAAPWTDWLNPARQVYDALFGLYRHGAFDGAAQVLAQLAALAAVLFGVVAIGLRRQRYAHL